jgi:hypothetical protein
MSVLDEMNCKGRAHEQKVPQSHEYACFAHGKIMLKKITGYDTAQPCGLNGYIPETYIDGVVAKSMQTW